MAVVQISRIQVRRGKANSGTGLPQLASGELAWAIDNQKLYIGNGSVAEGSPGVGNTQILTENDLTAQGNILNLIQHIYKVGEGDTIQTGHTRNDPVTRYLQDRLDDRVTTTDFGTVGDGIADDTEALQRAICQLYLNPSTVGTTANRVILEIPAGSFKVTSTIYVPSYATIYGAGVGSTVIEFTGTGPVFAFVNDNTTYSGINGATVTPGTLLSSTYINQPRNINLSDITINIHGTAVTGLKLNAVRDSVFNNITISSLWAGENTSAEVNYSKAIDLDAKSTLVTSTRNQFINISVNNFRTAVYSNKDITHNDFKDFYVETARQGFVFGEGDAADAEHGNTVGPTENQINSCYFKTLAQHAVYINRGFGNEVYNCQAEDVGNDTGGQENAKYPQIYFAQPNNKLDSFRSDRHVELGLNTLRNSIPYVPELGGQGTYQSYGSTAIGLTYVSVSPSLAFRLPVSTDADGIPVESISYVIEYIFKSTEPTGGVTRKGTLTVQANIDTKEVQLADDYNYNGPDRLSTGSPNNRVDTALAFGVYLLDETGGSAQGLEVPYSIAIKYTNNDSTTAPGVLTYSYKSTTSYSGTI